MFFPIIYSIINSLLIFKRKAFAQIEGGYHDGVRAMKLLISVSHKIKGSDKPVVTAKVVDIPQGYYITKINDSIRKKDHRNCEILFYKIEGHDGSYCETVNFKEIEGKVCTISYCWINCL